MASPLYAKTLHSNLARDKGVRRRGQITMALSEFERSRYARIVSTYVESHRPPAHIRPQLDIGYRITGQSVEIFEIRSLWTDETQKIEQPVAKATYVKTQRRWRIYWQRADLNWHRYEPDPDVETLEEFLAIVELDEYSCFWG